MAASKMTLEEQKRQLIVRSDLYRQAMADEVELVRDSFGWVPRALRLARAVSPLLIVAAPVLTWTFRRRAHEAVPQAKRARGLLAKAWGGFQLFQRVLPIWQGIRRARGVG